MKGGEFLLRAADPAAVFIPEELGEEQQLIRETIRSFTNDQVLPSMPAFEQHDYAALRRMLKAAADLGLTGADVPEEFGGLGLDKITSAVIAEALGPMGSFGVTIGGHAGIGTLPIVFFGNPEQKRKYLPILARAEQVSSYSLTEPGSGSDALGARAVAKLSADGKHYILNGTKQWTTNGGFADIMVLYAKIDGEHFSAFIVERAFPGVSSGPEENKLGIKGSSTTQIILEDAQVPVENLLFEAGKGHHVAFNILNLGRFKLAAGCSGSAKALVEIAVRYAHERHQFGKPLAAFPLIQQKLAAMAARTYVLESMIYRTAALLEQALQGVDLTAADAGQHSARAIAEYAVEASVCKVFGSEALDFVVDEAVQIHGGYGFMEEYAVCRAYRDSRINRIFEGTNEINRMLIPGTVMKKAMKGELPVLQAMQQLQGELMAMTPPADFGADPLGLEKHLIDVCRKLFLMVSGLAVQKHGSGLEQQQELLVAAADVAIAIYAMESAVVRAAKAGGDTAQAAVDLARLFVHQTFGQVELGARQALAALAEGDALRMQLSVLRKLTRYEPADTVSLGRRVAARVLAAG